MKKKYLIVIFLALMMGTLSGCATYEWRHPTKNQSDFDRDRIQCEYEAQKATAYYAYDFAAQVEQSMQRTKIFNMCMQTKGYYMAKPDRSNNNSKDVSESAKGAAEAIMKTKNAQKVAATSQVK